MNGLGEYLAGGNDGPGGQSRPTRNDGAAVSCPECGARFGGMVRCPWDDSTLVPLPDADPTAVAFYDAIGVKEDGR